jgi:hypothetical protein
MKHMKKRGAMELEEIVKLLIAVLVLVVLVGATIFLLSGKGGELIQAMKNSMRIR